MYSNLALGSFGLNYSLAHWMTIAQLCFTGGAAVFSVIWLLWEFRRPIARQQPKITPEIPQSRAA